MAQKIKQSHIAVAMRWARGEIGTHEAAHRLKKPPMTVYILLARALREIIKNNATK
jgi:hypothetical protein